MVNFLFIEFFMLLRLQMLLSSKELPLPIISSLPIHCTRENITRRPGHHKRNNGHNIRDWSLFRGRGGLVQIGGGSMIYMQRKGRHIVRFKGVSE